MIETIKNIIRKYNVMQLQRVAALSKNLNLNGRILIIAPHPDDEVFGCGGFIARLCSNGNTPHILMLTGGGGSHRGECKTPEHEIIRNRRILTKEALNTLGVPDLNIHTFDLIDGAIKESFEQPGIQKELNEFIDFLKPDVVLVPHRNEGWQDHLSARNIGISLAPSSAVIYEYCVWFWYYIQRKIDRQNTYHLKMTKQEHALKLKAIDIYKSALAPCGKPWIGVLPPIFLNANSTDCELFFKIDNHV